MQIKKLVSIFLAAILSSFSAASFASTEFITIGTGGVTGVYYPAGGAICRLINKDRKEHGIRCSVESTGASVYNVNSIRSGELNFGIAQSDVVYHAYRGEAEFKKAGADKNLRTVFALYPEVFTIVARADKNIKEFDDLKGKRVNIGNPGSGQRSTLEAILAEQGKSTAIYSLRAELKASEMASALCDNKIDAMIYFVGHPSGAIKEATTTCESRLVNVRGKAIEQIIKKKPFYQKAEIAAGLYRNNPSATQSFGAITLLTTSSKTSDKAVYTLVKAVFENFDSFKKLHPAFNNLKKSDMVKASANAPLHPGAIKYFKEVKLLK